MQNVYFLTDEVIAKVQHQFFETPCTQRKTYKYGYEQPTKHLTYTVMCYYKNLRNDFV